MRRKQDSARRWIRRFEAGKFIPSPIVMNIPRVARRIGRERAIFSVARDGVYRHPVGTLANRQQLSLPESAAKHGRLS